MDSVIDFGTRPGQITPRTRLPRESLRHKSTNCIDGTVLMASLLEAASLQPAIVLVPGHAFVAWETWDGTDEWDYLETTMIASHDFEEARQHTDRSSSASRPRTCRPTTDRSSASSSSTTCGRRGSGRWNERRSLVRNGRSAGIRPRQDSRPDGVTHFGVGEVTVGSDEHPLVLADDAAGFEVVDPPGLECVGLRGGLEGAELGPVIQPAEAEAADCAVLRQCVVVIDLSEKEASRVGGSELSQQAVEELRKRYVAAAHTKTRTLKIVRA